MDPAVQEILAYMGILISLALSLSFIFVIYYTFKSGALRYKRYKLSEDDFFSNFPKISSDIRYYASGWFTKSIEMRFLNINSGNEKPFAIANAGLNFFAGLKEKINIAKIKGAIVIDFSPSGRVHAEIKNSVVLVKSAGDLIGTIDLKANTCTMNGKPVGNFQREDIPITWMDVIGLPFVSRKENFRVNYGVNMYGTEVCRINFRKWPDFYEPLFSNAQGKLSKADMTMLIVLAAFEFSLSTNLRRP